MNLSLIQYLPVGEIVGAGTQKSGAALDIPKAAAKANQIALPPITRGIVQLTSSQAQPKAEPQQRNLGV